MELINYKTGRAAIGLGLKKEYERKEPLRTGLIMLASRRHQG